MGAWMPFMGPRTGSKPGSAAALVNYLGMGDFPSWAKLLWLLSNHSLLGGELGSGKDCAIVSLPAGPEGISIEEAATCLRDSGITCAGHP